MSMAHREKAHFNRLANAKSPYLLQHANNLVNWYEWGQEAFDRAKSENKPILLSVGYSSCHRCHVIARESFEDKVTAKIMNKSFINVKVDREERPDVERLYMTFLQILQDTRVDGVWPMFMWLTPELHPFFGQTYMPPERFRQVLLTLTTLWKNDPDMCVKAGKQAIDVLKEISSIPPESNIDITALASRVYESLSRHFDAEEGGFGDEPKFPSPAQTTHFLARYAAYFLATPDVSKKQKEQAEAAKNISVYTMVKIYNGGIRDVVGGGFSRYSVDDMWHRPSFEKMLYDQAQLLSSSLELYQLLPAISRLRDKKTLALMAKDIVSYVATDLTSPQGGFYSAEAAHSRPTNESVDKKEGAFYVWTAGQLYELLGPDVDMFGYHFNVQDHGNCHRDHMTGDLEGQNVLYIAHNPTETAKVFGRSVKDVLKTLDANLATLREHRDKHRPRPQLDDKIMTCWNGLMISGLSRTYEVFNTQPRIAANALRLAEGSAAFVRRHSYDEKSGELRRSYREGQGPPGQADDYAFFIQGLLDLYEASGKEEYLLWAIRLQEKQDELFYDTQQGGYFASTLDEHVPIRMKDAQDGEEPSAVSITLSNLQRIAHFAEDNHVAYNEKAHSILFSNGQLLNQAPHESASMVSAALMADKGYIQLIHTGSSKNSPFLELIRSKFIPNRVLIHFDPAKPPRGLAKVNGSVRSLIEELEKKGAVAVGKNNVRICKNLTYGLPIDDVEELKGKLPLIKGT